MKNIIIFVAIGLTCLSVILCLKYYNKKMNEYNGEQQRLEQLIKSKNDREKEINEDASYWSKIRNNIFDKKIIKDMPVTKHFIDKFHKTSNLLDFVIDNTIPDYEWEYVKDGKLSKNKGMYYDFGEHGEETIEYQMQYDITPDLLLNDIILLGKRIIVDKNGRHVEYPRCFYYGDHDNPYDEFGYLITPTSVRNNKLYMTNNFYAQYPNYPNQGIFYDDKYLVTKLTSIIDNKTRIYKLLDIDYTKTYEVSVFIDKNGYVDGVSKKLLSNEITKDPQNVLDMYSESEVIDEPYILYTDLEK